MQLPGAAVQVAPTTNGGLIALANDGQASHAIYYRDLAAGTWSLRGGAASRIAVNPSSIYATNAAGSIFSSPLRAPAGTTGLPLPGPALGPKTTWGPASVANAFNFPVQSGFDGTGVTVAFIMSSSMALSDVNAYLSYFNVPQTGRSIVATIVDGGSVVPSALAQGEATLDVETIAGLAPGANIVLYVVPSLSLASLNDAISAVISDGAASVISYSAGGCEGTASLTTSAVLARAALAGIAFVASSGDQGSACFIGTNTLGKKIYQTGVTYPASDPQAIGVGGNETDVSLTNPATWSDSYFSFGPAASGGGISSLFPIPSYQVGVAGLASTQSRNVPDVTMPSVFASVYEASAGGWLSYGGTSWSAPQFAAMLAETFQYCGKGFTGAAALPYYIVGRAGYSAFLDVISGSNAYQLASGSSSPAYYAAPGYDNTSGIGIPLGMPFAQTLCPGRVAPRSIGVSPPAQQRIGLGLTRGLVADVRPRVLDLLDRGRRPAATATRIQVVLLGNDAAAEEAAVTAALTGAGFSIDRTFAARTVVDAVGESGLVERFFGTEMHDYDQGVNGTVYAPARTITIPAALAPYVAGILLDNAVTMAPPSPLTRR